MRTSAPVVATAAPSAPLRMTRWLRVSVPPVAAIAGAVAGLTSCGNADGLRPAARKALESPATVSVDAIDSRSMYVPLGAIHSVSPGSAIAAPAPTVPNGLAKVPNAGVPARAWSIQIRLGWWTTTRTVSRTFAAWTVTSVVPYPVAVTTPSCPTVATVGADEVQRCAKPVTVAPAALRTVAV